MLFFTIAIVLRVHFRSEVICRRESVAVDPFHHIAFDERLERMRVLPEIQTSLVFSIQRRRFTSVFKCKCFLPMSCDKLFPTCIQDSGKDSIASHSFVGLPFLQSFREL